MSDKEVVRTLIYIPIVHSQAEMGAMADSLMEEYVARFGHKLYKEHTEAINEMWKGIRHKLNKMKLEYKNVRVYQDGLPVCGKEIEIVLKAAKLGSQSHHLIFDLVKRGAKLEGTEDWNLLIKEYGILHKYFSTKEKLKRLQLIGEYSKLTHQLLNERDQFIARRIDETLRQGEIGILFMGVAHEVDKILPKDIDIKYVIYNLPFRKEFKGG